MHSLETRNILISKIWIHRRSVSDKKSNYVSRKGDNNLQVSVLINFFEGNIIVKGTNITITNEGDNYLKKYLRCNT